MEQFGFVPPPDKNNWGNKDKLVFTHPAYAATSNDNDPFNPMFKSDPVKGHFTDRQKVVLNRRGVERLMRSLRAVLNKERSKQPQSISIAELLPPAAQPPVVPIAHETPVTIAAVIETEATMPPVPEPEPVTPPAPAQPEAEQPVPPPPKEPEIPAPPAQAAAALADASPTHELEPVDSIAERINPTMDMHNPATLIFDASALKTLLINGGKGRTLLEKIRAGRNQ